MSSGGSKNANFDVLFIGNVSLQRDEEGGREGERGRGKGSNTQNNINDNEENFRTSSLWEYDKYVQSLGSK